MAFTPNIPASGQKLGASRSQVINNFSNYFTVMSTNHVAPNSSGQGKHSFVQMPVQASSPSTLAGEGGLFTRSLSSDLTKSILYYQRDANTSINQPVLPMATCTFILRNTNGAATQVMGYNITSVTRTGTGAYTVVLGVILPYVAGTTEYGVLYSEQGVPSSSATIAYTNTITTVGSTSTGFTIQLRTDQGVAVDDPGNRLTFSVIQ